LPSDRRNAQRDALPGCRIPVSSRPVRREVEPLPRRRRRAPPVPRWQRRIVSNLPTFNTARAERAIRKLGAETPIKERHYTLPAVAFLLGVTEKWIVARVERGVFPAPDRYGRWRAADIDPLVAKEGRAPLERRLIADAHGLTSYSLLVGREAARRRTEDEQEN